MSQWNNSYAYNNQYPTNDSTWSGDPNSIYMNQTYYNNGSYDPSNQYVSFNEFITQIQANEPASSTNFNNPQFQNHPVNNQNTHEMPATNQNQDNQVQNPSTMSNGMSSNSSETHSNNGPSTSSYQNELVFKSNLTPTATEFVPKNSNVANKKQSSSSRNVPSDHSKPFVQRDNKNTHKSSFETNWRERPQQNNYQNGNSRYQNTEENLPENSRRYDPNYHSRSNQDSGYTQENRNRYQDSSINSQENRSRYQDSNSSNQENRNRYHDSGNSNQDYRSRHQDSNSSNQDNRGRYQESNARNYESNYRNERNPSKFNNKSKNNKDVERTFYNSTINKVQDSKNARGEGSGRNRNWVGSQRVRTERNVVEDEQYANDYLQLREEKAERITRDVKSSPSRSRVKTHEAEIELTQRDRLTEQLDKGTLECLVCCERVKQIDSVWSCGNCYHVLHLRCIRKWAMSSLVEGKWRCPACQNTSDTIPTDYRCMCGAVRSPEYQRGSSGAHTCGKSCKRQRPCPHPCTLLCHPGPCPPCQATVKKQCGCGAETRSILCSSKLPQVCGRVCNKTLDCGVHTCSKDCHEGECEECQETVTQVCYCPAAKSRSVPCTAATGKEKSWSCGSSCSRILSCGAHVCRASCHPPPCQPCELLPEAVITCPCARTKLQKDSRKKCTDPIPLCENICAKPLACGPDGDKHFCKLNCHHGACPVCPEKTLMQCRCGHSSREIPCAELLELGNNVLCQKKCNKKLSCGRHRCREVCCNVGQHRCSVICGRMLQCQLHRCEQFCHTGHCAPCAQVSFDELRCECGLEVIMPPVRCGTRPPVCSAPCRRRRPCGHEPLHACHAGPCPPCVVLTARRCHGGHEERKTIPCSQEEFSCGLPCGKPLPCGKHTCIKVCHKGPCDTEKCTQPCREKRAACGHECAAPCHAGGGACPSPAPCRRPVRAVCPCRRRSAPRPCAENAALYARIISTLAATKIQEGGSMDISEVQRPEAMLRTLECDDECRVEARTRQLALALQIRNPDISSKLAPRYSDFVKQMATKDPSFARQIHDKMTELVQLAKKSKQKTRSHSFPSMNWQKRQFIHELCEHFGCESVAYDAEPNRNVVATADREKSWLPAMSILEVLARDAGKRKVPGPILRSPANAAAGSTSAGVASAAGTNKPASSWATLTSTNAWAARSQPKPAETKPSEPKIDYFDNPPEN